MFVRKGDRAFLLSITAWIMHAAHRYRAPRLDDHAGARGTLNL